jgi:hypothetical protein
MYDKEKEIMFKKKIVLFIYFLFTEPSSVIVHLRVQWLISQLTKILLN